MENREQMKQENPWNTYIRDYRKKHPEKTEQYRVNGAKKLLEKKGFTVIAPAPEPFQAEETGEA